jgi:hypothetical protein
MLRQGGFLPGNYSREAYLETLVDILFEASRPNLETQKNITALLLDLAWPRVRAAIAAACYRLHRPGCFRLAVSFGRLS